MKAEQRGLFDPPVDTDVDAVALQEPPGRTETVKTQNDTAELTTPHSKPERSSWEATMADYLAWRY